MHNVSLHNTLSLDISLWWYLKTYLIFWICQKHVIKFLSYPIRCSNIDYFNHQVTALVSLIDWLQKFTEFDSWVILSGIYHPHVTHLLYSPSKKISPGRDSSVSDIWSSTKFHLFDNYFPLLFLPLWLFVSSSESDDYLTF